MTGNSGLPAGTPNPTFYNNKAGALEMRNAALFAFERALPQYVVDVGLLTDELEDANTGASQGVLLATQTVTDPLDERILPEGVSGGSKDGSGDYGNLQGIRSVLNQAVGAVATYDTAAADTASAKILRGELYALEGYAEVMLADLFCSGVPLSTLDFQKDFTYAPSSTTAQVYQDALAKFDTALALADTSTQMINLARVGRGRAWLNLAQYDSAAAAVASVPDGFQYALAFKLGEPGSGCGGGSLDNVITCAAATVSDREGANGLPYLSSSDPRTAVDTIATNHFGVPLSVPSTFPSKYSAALSGNGYGQFTVANGIEARLIQEEAQLQPASAPSGPWRTTLDQLRESIQLSDTADPGTAQGRIALLFHERAYWLFLTGHRQGDLRRLIRQYGRRQAQVYPTGQYLAPGTGVYGTDVTAPIPTTEDPNPLFHGCLSRGA